jgi:hypothetical protein
MQTRKCVAPLEAPSGANGRADKNGHFRVRQATETDAREQFRRPFCVVPLGALKLISS